jgi:CubicO group peptidase (beta-lactamase class C family)
MQLEGHCERRFETLEQAFRENFTDHGEVGARVTVIQDGSTVVDRWGGFGDAERTSPWREDTLVCTMSVSKGVSALCAHRLADRGELDYAAPVSSYWPEFAQNGKGEITVEQLLAHLAALNMIDAAEPDDVFDWNGFVRKIEAQKPNWEPGTKGTYHSVTYGFLVGELVRRVSGKPIERFVRDEVAGPLRADFVLGATDADLERWVPQIPNPKSELVIRLLSAQSEELQRVYKPFPSDPMAPLKPDYFRSVMPSANGISNAAGLARLFAPLATDGAFDGYRLFSPGTLARATAEQWHYPDPIFGDDFRCGMGLLLHTPFSYFGREGNVGSAGAGGYTVFADPEHRLSFAYTPNRFTSGEGLGDESRRLVDALYACL